MVSRASSEQVVVAGGAAGLVAVAWALVVAASALGRTDVSGTSDALWLLAIVLIGWAAIGCAVAVVLLVRRRAALSVPAVGLAVLGVAALVALLADHPLVGTGSATASW